MFLTKHCDINVKFRLNNKFVLFVCLFAKKSISKVMRFNTFPHSEPTFYLKDLFGEGPSFKV